MFPIMRQEGGKKAEAKAGKAEVSDNNGFFMPNDKIDFSKVKIEPLFEEQVDFETFSKSDFRAVKVKECVAVPKSKKRNAKYLYVCNAKYLYTLTNVTTCGIIFLYIILMYIQESNVQ